MDLKKRKADFQITPVDTAVNENGEDEQREDNLLESSSNLVVETPVVVSSGSIMNGRLI
jgi:hypothetical protein